MKNQTLVFFYEFDSDFKSESESESYSDPKYSVGAPESKPKPGLANA